MEKNSKFEDLINQLNEDVNSDEYKFVKSIVNEYLTRKNIAKETYLLQLIEGYKTNDYSNDIAIQHKINILSMITSFLNTFTKEEIEENIIIKSICKLLKKSVDDCLDIYEMSKHINSDDMIHLVNIKMDDELKSIIKNVSMPHVVDENKAQLYYASYFNNFLIYNKIIILLQRLCCDIYTLRFNEVLFYNNSLYTNYVFTINANNEDIFVFIENNDNENIRQ